MKKRSNNDSKVNTKDVIDSYVNNLMNELGTVHMYKAKKMLISYGQSHLIATNGHAAKQLAAPADSTPIFTVQLFNHTESGKAEINLVLHMGWWVPSRKSFVYDERTNNGAPQITGNIFSREATSKLYNPMIEAIERAGFSFRVTPTKEWKSVHISNALMELSLSCPCFSLMGRKRKMVVDDMGDCEPLDLDSDFVSEWNDKKEKMNLTQNINEK